MKYLLKQNKEDKGIFCEKVTIDVFDYYVSDEIQLGTNNVWVATKSRVFKFEMFMGVIKSDMPRLVIATNNPNIDIPKVVDEVEIVMSKYVINPNEHLWVKSVVRQFQSTYANSDEDMIEFNEWIVNNWSPNGRNGCWDSIELNSKKEPKYLVDSTKELLQIWKSSQPKIVYYG